jgi:hypothetical protein
MKHLFLITFLSASILSIAQKKEAACKFHSINSLSLLNGDNEVSAGLQSVNGIQKKNWFAGVGVGLDYYIYRSVPFFADVRYEFGKGKNKFFAYADGGINFQWTERIIYEEPIWSPGNEYSREFHNGFYTDAGFGYIVAMKKSGGLALSLGHSHKTSREDVTYTDWRTQQPTTDIYRYRFNRIVVKVGWKF